MASLEAAVKRTQEQFKDLIKKPPLTEKLLSRPPFRYLHDVIMELGRKHRFLRGLYSGPELDWETLKDKEAKLAFLQKSIDALAILQGAPMSCKASRMVSGQEPEKTNEFLQLMAATVVSKQDTTDAVRQVLGKGGKSKEPEAKETSKSKEPSDAKPARDKKHRSSREPAAAAAAAEDTGAAAAAATGGAEAASAAPAGDEASGGQAKESRRTRKPKEEESKEVRSKERRREGRSKEETEPRGKEAKPKESSESRGKEGKSKDEDRERRRERKERERAKADEKSKRREGGTSEKPLKPEEQPEEPPRASEPPPEKVERPSSPRGAKRGRRASDKDAEEPSPAVPRKAAPATQESDFHRPPLPPGLQAGKQRGPARPSSARPAPPKVRSRQDSAGSEDALSRVSSNVTVQPAAAVVVDDDDDDDNDDMLVVDTSMAPITSEQLAAPTLDKDADPAEHGLLVRKILDTKKEQEQVSGQSSSQESAITNAQRRKMKEKTEKEVTKLRESVQTLCRSANPLAKTVDFIQEDVESMMRELDRWQEEAQQNSSDLIKERELTETELEPLRHNLAELEATTVEKLDLIGVLKASIAKNDQQINQLVSGIALSSRQ